jgi:glycosyltransferase involved in cell wall biosynthesis
MKPTGENPIVSIVLPSYNSGHALGHSIQSAIDQTLHEWELIIVDDASTDGTQELLKDYAARDPRIKLILKEKNEFREMGISGSLDRGVHMARGRYIARLDDDDYWIDPDKLKKQAAYLDAHPRCVIVGTGVVVVDGQGNERFRYLKKETDAQIRASALSANPFSHTTVMFRKDVAEVVGSYQGKHIEDWDLWLRMGLRGEFYNLPEYSTAYTMTDQNASFKNQRALSAFVLKLIARYRGTYPGFVKGYILNTGQYLFARLPIGIRKRLHSFLVKIKRKAL